MTRHRLAASVLVLLAAASPAPASEPVPDSVATLPAEVRTVQSEGWWSEGARSGSLRVVMTEHGFDKVVSRLYLQWLEIDETGARVVASLGFEQLNQVPVYQIEISTIRPLENGIEVELEASSLYLGETRTFVLRAGSPGVATLVERY